MTHRGVGQLNDDVEDNESQAPGGQRREMQTQKGRLELEVLRCWMGNKGIGMN